MILWQGDIPADFKNEIDISKLDKESILQDNVFEYALSISDPLEKTKIIVDLQEKARALNVLTSFKKLLAAHVTALAQKLKSMGSSRTNFTDCPIEPLKCGQWDCKDSGISKMKISPTGEPIVITACPHPILPTERLVNLETGTEKVTLAFFKDNRWQNVTVDKSTIASKTAIVTLSDRGIEVNSENARDLVVYLSEVISLNMLEIPVYKSISRLGWVDGEFAPYIKDVKYDGDMAFKDLYESFAPCGDFDAWKKEISVLKQNKTMHTLIASSFASPLIPLVGALPYIVEIWGGTGTGKTVGLMAAMSIWGNPELGKLVRSLNSTRVAMGRTASFLHNLPFAGDELQIIKNNWDSFDSLVMYLTEGIDRGRGRAYGGVEKLETWRCNFIFSGEEPVTKVASGGGVKNRVIEIETTKPLVEDGNHTSNLFRSNHGFAGPEFIKNLPPKEELQERYRQIHKDILSKCDTEAKQAMAMATILLADELSEQIIFKDGNLLKIDDVKHWLKSKKEVDASERAHDWLVNWVSANQKRFTNDDNKGEVWGRLDFDKNICLINKSVLETAFEKEGFSYAAVIPKMAERGQIIKDTQGKFVNRTHVFGIRGSYIKINLDCDQLSLIAEETDDPLPF